MRNFNNDISSEEHFENKNKNSKGALITPRKSYFCQYGIFEFYLVTQSL